MSLSVKADSYVIETNVHFPTDLNLTWDCGRKCMDTIDHLVAELGSLPQWRQNQYWRKKLKRLYRRSAEIHRKKGNNYQQRLENSTRSYLSCCRQISKKVGQIIKDKSIHHTSTSILYLIVLEDYKQLLDKHIDLVERRIIKGEKIPHEEKIFSIFEPHTEWLNKGKLHKNVELGLNTVIATDQHHFILHHHVMQKQVDLHMTIPIAQYIAQHYKEYHLESISFDRNYYSHNAKEVVSQLFDQVILPKPGKKSKLQQEHEATKTFSGLRGQHSTVEANINQLEHHGLNRCPDKGIRGFKRYVALGVIAYNLHKLGNMIKNQNTS